MIVGQNSKIYLSKKNTVKTPNYEEYLNKWYTVENTMMLLDKKNLIVVGVKENHNIDLIPVAYDRWKIVPKGYFVNGNDSRTSTR